MSDRESNDGLTTAKEGEEEEWGRPEQESTSINLSLTAPIQNVASSVTRARKPVATEIRFQELRSRSDIARVRLVICNISERWLNFKIKCGMESQISALPSGTGDVEPRGQLRVTLSWHRPSEKATWAECASPKMLLVTQYRESGHPTQTRLLGKINARKRCHPDFPPETQLLLDASGKEDIMKDTIVPVVERHYSLILTLVVVYLTVVLLNWLGGLIA